MGNYVTTMHKDFWQLKYNVKMYKAKIMKHLIINKYNDYDDIFILYTP